MITEDEMLRLLHADVVPALGCTEPVCVALAAADAAKRAGGIVQTIYATVNPGIYKNGMSVAIPNYPDVGLDAAAALGALLANPEKQLEVFEDITPAIADTAKDLLSAGKIRVDIDETQGMLYAKVEVTTTAHTAVTIIRNMATVGIQGMQQADKEILQIMLHKK